MGCSRVSASTKLATDARQAAAAGQPDVSADGVRLRVLTVRRLGRVSFHADSMASGQASLKVWLVERTHGPGCRWRRTNASGDGGASVLSAADRLDPRAATRARRYHTRRRRHASGRLQPARNPSAGRGGLQSGGRASPHVLIHRRKECTGSLHIISGLTSLAGQCRPIGTPLGIRYLLG
jgi:hypothetical protein